MENLLKYLDGKKTIILAVIGLIDGYLVTTGTIDGLLGALILSILNILGGGAALATNKILGARIRMK
jgi:hypothetical protein